MDTCIYIYMYPRYLSTIQHPQSQHSAPTIAAGNPLLSRVLSASLWAAGSVGSSLHPDFQFCVTILGPWGSTKKSQGALEPNWKTFRSGEHCGHIHPFQQTSKLNETILFTLIYVVVMCVYSKKRYIYIYITPFCPLCTRSPSWKFQQIELRTVKATEVLWIPQKDANTKTHVQTALAVPLSGGGVGLFWAWNHSVQQLISSDRKHHFLLPALHKISQLKVSADRTQNGESNRGFVDTSKGCQHQKLMSKLLWPFPSPVVESFD